MKTYNQKYRVVGSYFLLVLVIILVALLIFTFIVATNESFNIYPFLYSMSAVVGLFTIWAINGVTKRVFIDDTKLRYISLFKKKEILLQDIKGFSTQTFSIKIADNNNKILKTFRHIKLSNWLEENYEDIDISNAVKEMEKTLEDSRHGFTEEDRIKSIKTADTFSNTLSIFIYIYIGLLAFISLPKELSLVVGIVSAILIVVSLFYFKGKVRLERKTLLPSLFSASFFTSMALLTSYMQYGDLGSFSSYKPMLIIPIVLTALYVLYVVGVKKYKFKDIWIPLVLFSSLTVTGALALNIYLDSSEPKIYTTQIIEHKIEYNSRRFIYKEIILSPWQKLNTKTNPEVNVPYQIYKTVRIGETVQIHQYKGYFNKKWFKVYKDDKEINGLTSIFGYIKYRINK